MQPPDAEHANSRVEYVAGFRLFESGDRFYGGWYRIPLFQKKADALEANQTRENVVQSCCIYFRVGQLSDPNLLLNHNYHERSKYVLPLEFAEFDEAKVLQRKLQKNLQQPGIFEARPPQKSSKGELNPKSKKLLSNYKLNYNNIQLMPLDAKATVATPQPEKSKFMTPKTIQQIYFIDEGQLIVRFNYFKAVKEKIQVEQSSLELQLGLFNRSAADQAPIKDRSGNPCFFREKMKILQIIDNIVILENKFAFNVNKQFLFKHYGQKTIQDIELQIAVYSADQQRKLGSISLKILNFDGSYLRDNQVYNLLKDYQATTYFISFSFSTVKQSLSELRQ